MSSSKDNSTMHPLTMIPGPIEFDNEVLAAMSHYSVAHTATPFVQVFSEALTLLRVLFLSKDKSAQPFVLSGSGTLGWDIVAANLLEAGENALVLNTGYFSDSFADCLETYGVHVDQLTAEIGDRPSLNEVESALQKKKYKVITITHVDTSTGVLSDVKAVSEIVRKVSPETLVIVDGVCSVGVEELRFDDWDLDFVLSASQKAIGAPAGLSISFASKRALDSIKNRKTPVPAYFANLNRWLPIMQAYEAGGPAKYFATPAVQNVYALHASLKQIAPTTKAVEDRFIAHAKTSDWVKDSLNSMGLNIVAKERSKAAHGMTAVYLPSGVENTELLPFMLKNGVQLAGGIHQKIATKYFRIGHMGISATNVSNGHIDKVLSLLPKILKK